MEISSVQIDRVDIDGRLHPLGIDNRTPLFHFTLSSQENGKQVLFHQIQVHTGDELVWDTGKTTAGEVPYVPYMGPELHPGQEYTVSIRIWDEQDLPSLFSAPLTFETGLMNRGFTSEWAEPVQDDAEEEKELPFFRVFQNLPDHLGGHDRLKPARNIRKTFRLKSPVRKGRLYISAHGVYEIWINGHKAGGYYLEPGVSAYQKILYYRTYDISDLLMEGENVLAMTLADGWWIGRIGLIGSSCQYGNRLGFILQMEIEEADGASCMICSDDSFRCRTSEICYADLYMGEKRDNSLELTGWKERGFDDRDWGNCRNVSFNKDNLIACPIDGIVEYQRLVPRTWISSPRGECIIDFGQIIAGTVELELDGVRGQEITLDFSEVLDREGNYLRNIMGRNKDQTDCLICRDGKQTWRPLLTYHGFRYVRLTGISRQGILKADAIVLTSEMERTGNFECSHEGLTQLQQNILWSQRGNMLSIPTDCPQREKMGWTGDIQIYAKTGAFNYNLRSFLNGWLMNLRAEQLGNGAVPMIIPNFPHQEKMQRQIAGGDITSSGWSDSCILLPWYLYECYGDISVLTANFATMKKYLEFVKQQASLLPDDPEKMTKGQLKRNPWLWNTGYHFGDWLIPSLPDSPQGIQKGRAETGGIVGSCWYAITLDAFVKICRILIEKAGWKLEKIPSEAEKLLAKVRKAICEEYLDNNGSIKGPQYQGHYVMMLRSGAVEGELKDQVAEKLVSLIRSMKNRLDTGFSSVSFLLDVLAENGYRELAYKLLFQKDSPSWLYMVEKGATTIWEKWEAITPEGEITNSSFNHYVYGSVGDWIYRNIGGIRQGKPAYKHIVLEPDIQCGLSWAICEHLTPYGKLLCSWELKEKECIVELEIPVNTTAELHIHNTILKLDSGRYYFCFEIKSDKAGNSFS